MSEVLETVAGPASAAADGAYPKLLQSSPRMRSRDQRVLGAPPNPPRFRLSRFARFFLMRLGLVPAQLLFVLVLLYLALYEPANILANQNTGLLGFFTGFGQMVVNDFTGNWGISTFETYPGVPLSQLYSWVLPNSVELAAFALTFSAALAYPVSMITGWSRRPLTDTAGRVVSLIGTLLPVMVVGSLVVSATFFWFLDTYHDLPDVGFIPTLPWWEQFYGGYPDWIIYRSFSQPTGAPLIDGVIHHAWAFEQVVLVKTLIQATVIAMVYVTIFLRHSRSVVASASQELHLRAARSRGIRERTLLWRHTSRRVRPTFLLVFALTLPAYLGTQFAVEAVFADPGIGFITLCSLVGLGGGGLPALEAVMFMLALVVLIWLFVVDVIAKLMDPREVVASG
jgi:ABC-type dipeptide/oligopeptide/nickel transport system permease component